MKNRKLRITTSLILAAIISTSIYAADDKKVNPPKDLKESRETELSNLATKQIQRKEFPLSEEQAIWFKNQKEEQDRMRQESIRNPDVQNRTLDITPSIAQEERTIYSSVNYQTNLIFVDSLGNPWPIAKYGVGAQDYFIIDQYLEHALLVNPKLKYKKTNLTVILKGMETTPIVLSLKEDKEVVDYVTQVKIKGFSDASNNTEKKYENFKRQVVKNNNYLNEAISLMSDNITPVEALQLFPRKNGNDLVGVSAWQYKKNNYIRTKGELVIPQGNVVSTSVDGYQLYETPPINSAMIEMNGVIVTNIKLEKE